jgi:hypothetical protein
MPGRLLLFYSHTALEKASPLGKYYCRIAMSKDDIFENLRHLEMSFRYFM